MRERAAISLAGLNLRSGMRLCVLESSRTEPRKRCGGGHAAHQRFTADERTLATAARACVDVGRPLAPALVSPCQGRGEKAGKPPCVPSTGPFTSK